MVSVFLEVVCSSKIDDGDPSVTHAPVTLMHLLGWSIMELEELSKLRFWYPSLSNFKLLVGWFKPKLALVPRVDLVS